MRRYSADDEERLHAQDLVREWRRSGLLDPAQQVALERDLHVDVKRTNPFLRAVLALFTTLIVVAAVALIVVLLGLDSDNWSMAVITGLAAVGCIGLADYLVVRFRLYRFGVEEALGVLAAGLAMISGAVLTASLHLGSLRLEGTTAMILGAAAGAGLYARFGYLYAALGAVVCAAAVPFQLDVSRPLQHLLAAAAMTVILAAVRIKRIEHRDDHDGESYGWLQAAAAAGIYAALNLRLPWSEPWTAGVFYWSTYGATWVLPCAAFACAVRDRDRELLDVSLALGLITLMTNKPYLGRPQQTWDPIVLGAALVAAAALVRRWLAAGPDGRRHGFTASRLLEIERARLSLIGRASVLIPTPGTIRSSSPSSEPEFRGGRSGGAGAAGEF